MQRLEVQAPAVLRQARQVEVIEEQPRHGIAEVEGSLQPVRLEAQVAAAQDAAGEVEASSQAVAESELEVHFVAAEGKLHGEGARNACRLAPGGRQRQGDTGQVAGEGEPRRLIAGQVQLAEGIGAAADEGRQVQGQPVEQRRDRQIFTGEAQRERCVRAVLGEQDAHRTAPEPAPEIVAGEAAAAGIAHPPADALEHEPPGLHPQKRIVRARIHPDHGLAAPIQGQPQVQRSPHGPFRRPARDRGAGERGQRRGLDHRKAGAGVAGQRRRHRKHPLAVGAARGFSG